MVQATVLGVSYVVFLIFPAIIGMSGLLKFGYVTRSLPAIYTRHCVRCWGPRMNRNRSGAQSLGCGGGLLAMK